MLFRSELVLGGPGVGGWGGFAVVGVVCRNEIARKRGASHNAVGMLLFVA